MGGIFKALSAVAFFFAWKTYKLPNTTNRQDSTPSDVVSQMTIVDGHTFTEKLDVQFSPPVQQIIVRKFVCVKGFLINDFYPGSSTHPKVVFREVLHPIELNLEMLIF